VIAPTKVFVRATFGVTGDLVWDLLAATRAAALAAARWAGRGDPMAADGAATAAMRAALACTPGIGTIVTGEGAKDGAPMLADGERLGNNSGRAGESYDIAVDPLECTDLCARGLPGALTTLAAAPHGALWSPGPAFYMSKLVLPPAASAAAHISEPPEATVRNVAKALDKPIEELRIIVLDKPRHRELTRRLRATGAVVMTPTAGDVAGALAVLLPDGNADLLLGVGGTPEGVLAACAARALGGGMQGRLAPQREDECEALEAAGVSLERVLELDELVAAEATFVATGVTGGLLEPPRLEHGWLVTESIAISAAAIHRIRLTGPSV
jgi:fructose-1,6-bisphosphatase II